MATLELNIPAKESYNKVRRRHMNRWRLHKKIVFTNTALWLEWLNYTKWYDRPVKLKYLENFTVEVTFLDNMKGAK